MDQILRLMIYHEPFVTLRKEDSDAVTVCEVKINIRIKQNTIVWDVD